MILLYLEIFGNPKKFGEIARRVARTKPIIAVKAGRSAAGSRAAASHTGALTSSDTAVDALFRQPVSSERSVSRSCSMLRRCCRISQSRKARGWRS